MPTTPSFVQSDAVALAARAAPSAAPAPAGQPPEAAKLTRFQGIAQNAPQWCWVACTVMMARTLGVATFSDGSTLTQCGVFARVFRTGLGRSLSVDEICIHIKPQSRLTGKCDDTLCIHPNWRDEIGVVSEALAAIVDGARFEIKRRDDLRSKLEPLIREHIGLLGRPVAVLINPAGADPDTRHYILLTGYDTKTRTFQFWDPDDAAADRRSAKLEQWRQEVGEWLGAVFMLDRR